MIFRFPVGDILWSEFSGFIQNIVNNVYLCSLVIPHSTGFGWIRTSLSRCESQRELESLKSTQIPLAWCPWVDNTPITLESFGVHRDTSVYIPSLKLTIAPKKKYGGRPESSPFRMDSWQVRTVSFRECRLRYLFTASNSGGEGGWSCSPPK